MNTTIIDKLVISVVIPVRNDAAHLRSCIKALRRSAFQQYEIVIIDDASTDETPRVACELADEVIHLQKQVGPAGARNRGVKASRGRYILFVDADVCVHPDTLSRIVETFESDETIDALFGSYDRTPQAGNILSQYKNLSHHFVHQNSREKATTFWTGCGAIKRDVFLEIGGFDTSYGRPCIEDIELGARLVNAKYCIVLKKNIQVTHLKQWTFWNLIKTDVFDRGIPWTELMLRDRNVPNDLNLTFAQRFCAILSVAFVAIVMLGAWQGYSLPLVTLLVLVGSLGLIALDRWSVNHRVPTFMRIAAVILTILLLGVLTAKFHIWAVMGLACLAGIIVINRRFYAFLLRERHPLFAAIVVPLNVSYYLYSGFALAVGICLHVWRTRIRRQGHPGPSHQNLGE